ncbi:MAG: transposase [Alteromonadaceae bacterium]|uniref:recombinase family protein n=1 Tax=Paraglaciecola chathamensis TaxID=368405 RepID=UPI000C550281|nr:recombinase family protein [Paraglaciecola agarilytica]MBN28049.1 transposase [Alteromonadaceae bacterium]|tara:strand:+ start:47469 stop:48026 length:558 start_codon:yes stop_codon:yes gene_type:complete
MKGQTIGYIRVSSFEQNEARQLEKEALDRVFTDKASGKDTNRPQLKELIQFVREGDLVLVHSMDRLARNLDDLRKLVKSFVAKGVSVKFVKEGLLFSTEDDSPMSNLLLSVMGAFAEFERSLIKERQREGIELAKKKGVYKGRAKALSDEDIVLLNERVSAGVNKSTLAKEFGISRQTLYSYLRY